MKKLNLDKMFDNKNFLRIFAAVVAVLLWILVAMTTSSTTVHTIRNVPVNLEMQATTLKNQRLNVIDDTEYYVDVQVNGPYTVVGQLQPDSPGLLTTVKVSQVSGPETYNLPVVSGYTGAAELPYTIVGYTPRTISVKLDRLKSKTFEIQPVVKGLSTSPPFVFDTQYVTPDKVTVTGPEAEVDRIASCQVIADLTEPLEKIHASVLPIVLLDVQGSVINQEQQNLSLDVDEAQLVISVLKETGLPLEVDFLNSPRNFPLDELRESMTMSSDYVLLAGPAAVVDRLTQIVVGRIDIKALRPDSANFTFPLELKAISEDIKAINNVSSVEVQFDDTNWDTAVFHNVEVQMINTPTAYNVTLQSTAMDNVEIVGDADILATMTAADIVAELDLSQRDLAVGSQSYPVRISVPGKGLVWAVGDYTKVILVGEKE